MKPASTASTIPIRRLSRRRGRIARLLGSAALLCAVTAAGTPSPPATAGAEPGSAASGVTAPGAPAEAGYTWRNVQIMGGGFMPGIVYNDTEPGLAYARADIGGAYRLDTATGRWVPLLDWVGWDQWGWTGVVSMATDPVQTNRVYAAVGTYTNAWDPHNGAILRSADRGATWAVTNLPFKLGGNMPGRSMGERLAVDPNDNSILYLGSPKDGLWRSADYGATWARVASFPNAGDYIQDPNDPNDYLNQPIGVVWATFDKRTGSAGNPTQTIYVGVADKDGTDIYRTANAGATWELVPGQPTNLCCPQHGVLDHANGLLYVTYSNTPGPYDGSVGDVWRHNTATGAWTRISPMPSDDSNGDNYFGYGGISVDRQHPDTIMVSSFTSWWPDEMIWRSTDRGATWTRIWDWTRYPNRSFRYTHDVSASPWLDWGGAPTGGGRPGAEVYPKLGWMVGDLEIDPFNSNKMMYVTGATVYGSDDLTKWDAGQKITITVKAAGIEETAVQELVSPPSGPQLFSGMYDIYGFRHDDVTKVPNAFYENPRIATVSIDYAELNPSVVWRSGDGDAANGVKSAGYSTNSGAGWTPVGKEPAGVTNGGTIAVNADGARVVWSPDGARVHYTTNNGTSWTAATGIPAGAQVRSDRVNPNRFYGFANGSFYVSTDGGASFTASSATGLPSSGQFKVVPGKEGHLWLAGGEAGLWRSTDSGATFAKVASAAAAHTIGFGKAAPGQTYPALYSSGTVSGVRGIYRSDDAGATWLRVNDDQHQWGWTGKCITGDPRIYGRVYVCTNGRGIVYGDL